MRLIASLCAVLLTGCLTSTHVLPDGELMRLASLPPAERGQHVRVVQGFSGAEQPPEAPHVGAGVAIAVMPTPVPPGSGYGYGYFRPSAKDMKDEAKWWIAIAAITAVGLAVTEGARFDGWAELSPDHPIHLFGPNGEWTWLPLSQLDANAAAWARKAFVREEEGPWRRLERAPLDRVGFTYSLLMGTGEVPAFDDVKRPGFLSHIQMGFFPLQQLGLLLDIGLGWRTDRDYSDIFHSRYSFELQGYPLDLGRIHLGIYGQVGTAYRFEDFPDGTGTDRASYLLGGGLLAQLELTTRLAITVRAGADLFGGTHGAELTGGVSIY